MEIILLLIYSFFVWLIFFKFKLLPWNFISQVIVVTIPIVAIAALVLILNVVAPSSHDVRVVNQVVAVVPRVTGRVTEVPIEPNRPIKKGDVLFKIDAVPFQLEVDSLTARLAADEAKLAGDTARLAADQARVTSEESNAAGASASVTDAEAESRVLALNLAEMTAKSAAVRARLELAKKRLEQHRELVSGGAGDRFAFEQAEADVKQQEADLAAVTASEAQVKERLSAQVGGDLPGVAGAKAKLATAKSQVEIARAQTQVAAAQIAMSKAQIDATKAQLDEAKWKLDQCVYYAPANGTVVSLALRPGAVASIMVTQPVMTFVEDEQWVLAIYHQNEVRNVKPDQEAEVAFAMHPGKVIKCKVDSVMWATAQGQLPIGGNSTAGGVAPIPPHSLAVRLLIDEKDTDVFLASGAHGAGAIYTDSGEIIHIVRKIMVRIGAKLDWFVPKLH